MDANLSAHRSNVPDEDVAMTVSEERRLDDSAIDRDNGAGDDEDEDEEDEDDHSGSDDSEPLEDPSEDIRDDFEAVFDGSLDFQGSFSFHRTYPNAPNPTMYIEGMGHLGLPLNERTAQILTTYCRLAPFGKGERTVIDKSVRDTWEIDASKIRFDSATWQSWLDNTLKEVCTVLGVNTALSQPRCEPYKLLLYETGSHFLPHQDTEKTPGMFATIIVVLPTLHTGGAAHLSHSGLSVTLDSSQGSLTNTTVLAWYTDVMHEVRHVTSGYRLALSFNVVHTTTSIRPMLPDGDTSISRLRHVLLSWKQNEDTSPEKLIYLLDHQYSEANLRQGALKGADAHKVGLLEVLTDQYGFHLGLANLVCHLTGYAEEDYDDYGYYGRRGHLSGASMGEVEDREMTITKLVRLDGTRVQNEVNYEDDELIPAHLAKIVEDGSPDDEEYEGYQGNYAGSAEQWYRRTVLVIWPPWQNFAMQYSNNPRAAIAALRNAITRPPGHEELELVDFLLRCVTNGRMSASEVVETLCNAACSWKDLDLWMRSVKACNADKNTNIGSLGVVRALQAFGITQIKDVVASMLSNEAANHKRYNLIKDMSEASSNADDSSWVAFQRQCFIDSIKPLQSGDEQMFVELAKTDGGLDLLQTKILPQLLALDGSIVKTSLAEHLFKLRNDIARHANDLQAVQTVCTRLLQNAIQQVDFFAPKPTAQVPTHPSYPYYGSYRSQPAPPKPTPEIAFQLINVCVNTDNLGLLGGICDRLLQTDGLQQDVINIRSTAVLVPLIPMVGELQIPGSTESLQVPGLEKLCDRAVQLYMGQIGQRIPTKADLTAVFRAVVLSRSSKLLENTVLPKIKALTPTEAVWREVILQLEENKDRIVFPPGSTVSIASIKAGLIDELVKRAQFPKTSPSPLAELIDLCCKAGCVGAASVLFARMLRGDGETVTNQYITSLMVPLIPAVKEVLSRYKIPYTTEPFGNTFKFIMLAYANKILGPKPPNATPLIMQVQRNTCICRECGLVKNFLVGPGEQRTIQLSRIGAPKRKHVEKQIDMYGGRTVASYSTIGGSPQGLSVTKADALFKPSKWKVEQNKAYGVLKSISGRDEELRQIFGDEYGALMNRLKGISVESSRIALTNASANAVSSTSSAVSRASDAPKPPKRQKLSYNPADVVDLT